jgi:ketosteroid isomerase-like protein
VVSSCPNCRAKNVARNRFCGYCGARLPAVEKATVSPEAPTPEPHVHHHHYHHFSQPPDKASLAPSSLWVAQTAERAVDAERAIPKLVEEWCLLWNAKRLEDLVGLYSVDAIVLRPRAAYAQGRAAIRQLFKTALEAGVGEFELACGDLGVAGELACLAGYVQAAVPSAAGKRLEGSGKCLLVLRWEAGEWKIVADAWCLDERPSAAAESEGATILPMRSSLK